MKSLVKKYNQILSERSKMIRESNKAIKEINNEISKKLISILPQKRASISGVKNEFGDYITGISSKKINYRFGRSKLCYSASLEKGYTLLQRMSIETKMLLIQKLSKM